MAKLLRHCLGHPIRLHVSPDRASALRYGFQRIRCRRKSIAFSGRCSTTQQATLNNADSPEYFAENTPFLQEAGGSHAGPRS